MDLRFSLDKDNGIPLYVQLEQQIRLLIRSGRLAPGDPMPTVRQLAVDQRINYNTAARVYRDLQREGALQLRRGIGTFVSEVATQAPRPKHDFSLIEDRVQELIAVCDKAGLTLDQLNRFIELKWKEAEL